jgi:hypothetical protein
MRFFMMQLRSLEEHENPPNSSEAYASAWINDPNRESALEKATTLIQENGWNMVNIVEDYPISREDYSLKTEGLDYYDQAVVDGKVVVFFIPK